MTPLSNRNFQHSGVLSFIFIYFTSGKNLEAFQRSDCISLHINEPINLPFISLSSTLPLYIIFLALPTVTNSLIRDVYKEEMITFCYVYKVVVKNNKTKGKN